MLHIYIYIYIYGYLDTFSQEMKSCIDWRSEEHSVFIKVQFGAIALFRCVKIYKVNSQTCFIPYHFILPYDIFPRR